MRNKILAQTKSIKNINNRREKMIIYKICSHQFCKLKLVMCTFNDVKYEIYQVVLRILSHTHTVHNFKLVGIQKIR